MPFGEMIKVQRNALFNSNPFVRCIIAYVIQGQTFPPQKVKEKKRSEQMGMADPTVNLGIICTPNRPSPCFPLLP
jgi:hypothetical protein